MAKTIIDLSADFRLRNPDDYPTWYGHPHEAPHYLARFVYGIPELHREEINGVAAHHGGRLPRHGLHPGAAAALQARRRGAARGVHRGQGRLFGGRRHAEPLHPPSRAQRLRPLLPADRTPPHGGDRPGSRPRAAARTVHFSATAIEAVRGILATCHVFLKDGVEEKDIWKVYRAEYGNEPFIRIVKERQGIYRYPEPKILAGTNFCDIGFEKDPRGSRLVVMSALDNLVKGAAGNGVQAMNWPAACRRRRDWSSPGCIRCRSTVQNSARMGRSSPLEPNGRAAGAIQRTGQAAGAKRLSCCFARRAPCGTTGSLAWTGSSGLTIMAPRRSPPERARRS